MEKKSLEVRDGALDGTLGVASSSCAWAVGRTVGCESDGIGSRNNHSTGLNLSLSLNTSNINSWRIKPCEIAAGELPSTRMIR